LHLYQGPRDHLEDVDSKIPSNKVEIRRK